MLRKAFVCLTVAACAPGGEDSLSASGSLREIADTGEEVKVQFVATTASGHVGSGPVKVSSNVGALVEPVTLTLDAYGTVTVPFSCNVSLYPDCVGSATVTGEWTTGGRTVTATLKVTVQKPPDPWENDVTWDSEARSVSCSGVPAPMPQACTNGTCPHGFGCVNGLCLLNGANGGLQYTLRFTKPVDLDLHLVEPTHAGSCEVFWAEPNRGTNRTMCFARSSLDLDSNAGCNLDNVRTENIIFPRGKPVPGTYIARVDLFEACAQSGSFDWELQVRAGQTVKFYCGTFAPGDADRGGPGSGRTISTLTVPP